MNETTNIIGKFHYSPADLSMTPVAIKPAFRCSVWNSARLYSPAEILQIYNSQEIYPGDTARVEIMIFKGILSESLSPGDVLQWGVPYEAFGHIEVV